MLSTWNSHNIVREPYLILWNWRATYCANEAPQLDILKDSFMYIAFYLKKKLL